MRSAFVVVLLVLTISAGAVTAGNHPLDELLDSMTVVDLAQSDRAGIPLELSAVGEVRARLWAKYAREQRDDPRRREEHTSRRIAFGSVMRYAFALAGEKPEKGYPLYIALHGGGGAPAQVNDGGWNHMKAYYRDSVKCGIYLAPRGVSDTWNLHFMADSYPLYDRLIENMILFEGADPNRVYLLGYSAGGDGVYQVSPRMADRFAAAAMSAGHHNGVNPANLCNVPFLVQAGAQDTAYGRHVETARFALTLAARQAKYPGHYIHDCFIHLNRGHGIMDRDPAGGAQQVVADIAAWLDGAGGGARSVNANAIAWVSQHVRNPRPERVVWDLGTRADRSGIGADEKLWPTPNRDKQFYWLDVSGMENAAGGVLDVRVDKAGNRIVVEQADRPFRVLLSETMLDLSRPVTVVAGGATNTIDAHPNLRTLARTLIDRGDPHYAFPAAIEIAKP